MSAEPQALQVSNPWLVTVAISIATFMEVLDSTIVNVSLRYIAGGLAVGPDEASWVVTSYLVANAIVLCASSWISEAIGRRLFFLTCVAIFTVSSILSGLSWSLNSLLFFRIVQGLAGGGMTPVALSILAVTFPPEKRAQGFALYGVAVVVAPVVGPTLGGWLTDSLSWHWCFFINGPVGILCFVLIWVLLKDTPEAVRQRAERWRRGIGFDWIGFILVAGFLACLQVCLAEGQRKDWFASDFIRVFGTLSAACLVLSIPWELSRAKPLIDMRMLGTRQFGSCFVIMLATGGVLMATTQFMPQLLQDYYGYTAMLAGLALSPGGLVTAVMMAVIARASRYVPGKYLIAGGALIVAGAMYNLTKIYAGLDFDWFVWQRVYLGVGLPMIFLAITSASYDGIPPEKTDQASAMINVARNTGGSIGVAIAQNVLAERQQFHQSRLVENAIPSNPQYQEALRQVTEYFSQAGSIAEAKAQAFAWIAKEVQLQAAFLSYMDVFFVLALMSLAMVPLAFLLRSSVGGSPAGGR